MAKPKVYKRKQNPVTIIRPDQPPEVITDWHNSTPERRQAEDERKRVRKQKWLAARRRKKGRGAYPKGKRRSVPG